MKFIQFLQKAFLAMQKAVEAAVILFKMDWVIKQDYPLLQHTYISLE